MNACICILYVYPNYTFSVLLALKEAIDILDSMKGSYQSDKDRHLEGLKNVESKLSKQPDSSF